MSSYYTTAQLEAMRKALLKQELADSIQRLKEQLQTEHINSNHMTVGANNETTVVLEDYAVGGYSKNVVVTGAMLQTEECQSSGKQEELDFSRFLCSVNKKSTKLEYELDFWVKKIDERPIVSERDERDRTRLVAEIAKMIHVSTTDIEDKIRAVKMRVSAYLQGATRVTVADKEKMESTYYEYCALCKILEIKPTERFPYRVEKEVVRMTAVLEKRRQNEYVMGVIESIMEELGCHAIDDAILDHTVGQMYSVDGHPLCDVFIGHDSTGIMFEPVGESKDGTLERQRQIESSANSICSLYTTLEERAVEKGVILKRVYIEPAHIQEMCVHSDIREISDRKSQRRTSTQKQRALNSED